MSDITRDYSFGGWLRHLRVERGITLRKASILLKMDVGNLSKLERSELAPPRSSKRIEKICKRLGIQDAFDLLRSVAFQHHLAILKEEFEQSPSQTAEPK